jgi:hypothetical protein
VLVGLWSDSAQISGLVRRFCLVECGFVVLAAGDVARAGILVAGKALKCVNSFVL